MRLRHATRLLLGAGMIGLFWLVLALPASGQPPRNEPLDIPTTIKYASQSVAAFLRTYKETSVSVDIRVPAVMRGAGENALLQMLSEQLTKERIQIRAKATYTVRLECTLEKVRADDLSIDKASISVSTSALVARVPEKEKNFRLRLNLTVRMEDAFGKVILDTIATTRFENEAELMRYFDLTGKRNKDGTITSGGVVVIGGTQARAARDSKFAVEVQVGPRARGLEKEEKDPFCFVPLKLEEEYSIRLINESAEEVLARVRIDGLSVFHFSEIRADDDERKGRPKYRFFVVGPGKDVIVNSWHKRNSGTAPRFKIALPEESAAGKLGKSDKVGVIAVEFISCKKATTDEKRVTITDQLTKGMPVVIRRRDANGKEHTITELRPVAMSMMREGVKVGTGFGSEVTVDFKEVKRWIGPTEEVVAIHYARTK